MMRLRGGRNKDFMDSAKKQGKLRTISKADLMLIIYIVLNAIVIVAGGYLFFNVFQVVSRGTIISFWLCLVPPLIALGINVVDAALENWRRLRFPKVIFVISSVFLMWFADPATRNVEGQWANYWAIVLIAGVIILIAIVATHDKWGNSKKLNMLFKGVSFGIVAIFFVLGALLSANFALDTSEPSVTEQTVVSVRRRIGNPIDDFYVTIVDDAGNRTRLQTTATVYRHSSENIDGPILLVAREGALNIAYRRLALFGDGPGGIDRLWP